MEKPMTGWIVEICQQYVSGFDMDNCEFYFSDDISDAKIYVGEEPPYDDAECARSDHPAYEVCVPPIYYHKLTIINNGIMEVSE